MSNANGGTPAGKVRPAWMGGTTAQEEPVTTAPTTEEQDGQAPGEEVPAAEIPEQVMAQAQRLVDDEKQDLDRTERIETEQDPEVRPEPVEDYAGSASRTHSGAPSFGKKNVEGAAAQEESRSLPVSTAPTGLKDAIQGFVQRISGKSAPAARGPVSGAGEAAQSAKTRSAEQLEQELRLSLRDTTIEGFRRICFGSKKGGIGKSSLAYSAAAAISSTTNLRVCLVDADTNAGGATRYLVPHPVEQSVLDLADDAERLERLADLRTYVSQNKQMRLDVLLNPIESAQISAVEDLADAYARVDAVLSQFYDLVIYDLGPGFRDEAIRRVLGLSDELVLISDGDVIPNAQLPDTLRYVEGLGVNLQKTTLTINHGRPSQDESASATEIRDEFEGYVRRVTEVPYDATLSQLLNTRAFHIEKLALPARLGVLTTAAAALEGLRRDAWTNGYEKVLSMHRQHNGQKEGGR